MTPSSSSEHESNANTNTNKWYLCTPCHLYSMQEERERETRTWTISLCDHFTGKMKRKDNKSLSNLLLLFHSLSTLLSRLATSILKSDGRLLYDCLFYFLSLAHLSLRPFLFFLSPPNQYGGPKQKRDCLFNWEQHCITAFFPISPLY